MTILKVYGGFEPASSGIPFRGTLRLSHLLRCVSVIKQHVLDTTEIPGSYYHLNNRLKLSVEMVTTRLDINIKRGYCVFKWIDNVSPCVTVCHTVSNKDIFIISALYLDCSTESDGLFFSFANIYYRLKVGICP